MTSTASAFTVISTLSKFEIINSKFEIKKPPQKEAFFISLPQDRGRGTTLVVDEDEKIKAA